MLKMCTKCGESKPPSGFHKRAGTKDGLNTRCISCRSGHRSENWLRYGIRVAVHSARTRSRSKGVVFNITTDDLGIPDTCALSGVFFKPTPIPGTPFLYSPSIDRVRASEGYVKGNVRVILNGLNSFKGLATDEEILDIAEAMLRRNRPWLFK